ncbi:MAG TPA: HAD hydrolase-like protein [Candidatus Saccharimonadales bacterium]|nr:HAD hydrolase-like protein [Candidatus Saccharimonadales bacterium]
MLKRAVIFDFDGTIADSLPAAIQVFEELTARPERFSAAQIESFRDLSVPELIRALGIPKWKVPVLMVKGRKMLRDHLYGIPAHKGMHDLLAALYEQEIPLYVLSSNSTENVHSYLQRHKLTQYFSGIYGGASLLGKAPLILKMIKKEQLETEGSWYVGDEVRDVSAARAVGLHIASVSWGYNTHGALATKKPDAIVDTAEELQKLLEQAWKK